MRNYYLIAFFAYLFSFWGINCPAIIGQVLNHSLHFDHLSIRDGLSHNTVHCLLQDRHGFIWIGTQNGLNKYDGHRFELYLSQSRTGSSHGFIGKNITSLFEDRAGNLWVGTRKQGINFKEKGTSQFHNLQEDSAFLAIQGYDITDIFEDRAGMIWITSVGGGLLSYNPIADTSYRYTSSNGLTTDILFDIVEDSQGTLWVAGAGDGLNNLEKGEKEFSQTHVNLPNAPNMSGYRKTLFLDGEELWIGTEGTGLYRMSISDRNFVHIPQGADSNQLKSSSVRDIHKAKDGRIFLSTDGGGLHILDPSSLTMAQYTNQIGEITSLNSNALFCFLEDQTDNLWIGSYNGGINILKVHKTWFEQYSPSLFDGKELRNRSILGIHQSQNGDIWIGTDGGGLSRFDPTNNQFSPISLIHDPQDPSSISGNVVKTIYEDRQHQLWVGFFGSGLDVYSPTSKTFQPFQFLGHHIWSITESSKGHIWIGTLGFGIRVIDPVSGKVETYQANEHDPNSLSENIIMMIYIDQEDQVWVGTGDKGLDMWDEQTGGFHHFRHQVDDTMSLSNDEVRAIYQDSGGDLWIGTESGGLNRYLGNAQFERIDESDGLIANSVMGITEDQMGHLWISTFDGLSRLDLTSREIRNFGFHQDPHANQFNQMAILTGKDGKLYVGGINGLNTLDPTQVKEEPDPTAIVFTDFKIFANSISPGIQKDGRIILTTPIEDADLVQLSYLDNSFSVSFSATEYTNPSEHVFSYKMEGFDEQWQMTTKGQHSVSYTNLDPGTFVFHVKRRDKHAQLTISISPPFWQSTWFTLVAGGIMAALIVLGVRFVVKRREAAHKRQLLVAEREILQLRNEKLETEVNAKNSKLMFSAVQMAHKNEILNNVKSGIKDIQGNDADARKKLRQLVQKLEKELKSENYWKEFNLYFNQVDSNFSQDLLEKHPELTPNDLRICSLIRINLTTKEIASLLNISVRGVEQSRYRLRKRLGLDSNDNLVKYISSFS
ncbi:MAG: two-component regulator propeller domain-containing protein [Bacteroidota bacterium]